MVRRMDNLRMNLIRRLEEEKNKVIKSKASANKSIYDYDTLIDSYDKLLYSQYAELSKDIELEQKIKKQLQRRKKNGRFNNQ